MTAIPAVSLIAASRLSCLISIKSGTGPVDRMGVEESVRLAIFADIHANRQAFSPCLDFARGRGAERMICRVDYLRAGPHPAGTVDTVMRSAHIGPTRVRGNPA